MRYTFATIALAMLLTGCKDTPSNKGQETKANPKKENINSNNSQQFDDMRNPAIMMGSDLGSFIRKAYQVGDYDLMVQFTSQETIDKFGRDSLKNWYRDLDMGMYISLQSVTEEKNGLIIMHYETIEKATKVMRRLPVVIEEDTARIAPPFPNKGTVFEYTN